MAYSPLLSDANVDYIATGRGCCIGGVEGVRLLPDC